MNLFKKYFVLAAVLTVVTGCATKTDLDSLQGYNEEFKDANINVFLKSFSDHRQGKALLKPEGGNVIYSYDPQTITSGQMLPLLGYYIYNSVDFQNDNAKNSVGIDISVRNVDTSIRHGSLPVTRLGYYSVEVQARVIVRDMINNEVITTFPILVSDSKLRNTSTGRSPSAQEDSYAMLQLVDNVSLKLAEDVLDEVEDILEDYYVFDEMEEMFIEQTVAPTKQVDHIEKTKDIKVNQVKEEELEATAEMIDFIESEEQKLLDRKEAQRKLFEKKLEDQKYLDFLDKQQ